MADLKFNTFNLANPTGIPMTLEDVLAVRTRKTWLRTDLPVAGMLVKYRHHEHGPLFEAKILTVDMENRRDPGVWRYVLDANRYPVEVNGIRQMEMVEDPWPSVRLQVTAAGPLAGFICDTREARFPGSPGWLPKSVKE